MSRTAVYHTDVSWKGEHWGHIVMGNGPEMDFSAPPDAQGHPDVFTPEDAFVAAVNTCIMMMFIWAAERFKLGLLTYTCRAEGTKLIELDRTEIFTQVRLWPVIRLAANGEDPAKLTARVKRALQAAQKYSLVANSIKSEISLEADIQIVSGAALMAERTIMAEHQPNEEQIR
jgi:organic hydroperoxide reductase OsmC/OhrA